MYPSQKAVSAAFHEAQAACRAKVTRGGDVYGYWACCVVRADTHALTTATQRPRSAEVLSRKVNR